MSTVHVFVERKQPATDYWCSHIEPPMRFQMDDRCRLRCYNCGRIRWAKNMLVQVYYDCTRFTCVEGHDWDGRRRRYVTRTTHPKDRA